MFAQPLLSMSRYSTESQGEKSDSVQTLREVNKLEPWLCCLWRTRSAEMSTNDVNE